MNTRRIALFLGFALLLALSGCGSKKPQPPDYAGECARGIALPECLPGTAGYSKGGGQLHREAAERQRAQQLASAEAAMRASREACRSEFEQPALNPIRAKVELLRVSPEAPVPFAIAANADFPTEPERAAIARWAEIRDACSRREAAAPEAEGSALTAAQLRADRKFAADAEAQIALLVVALYQLKMSYGEFAQKRFEIGRAADAARIQYREAAQSQDWARRFQMEQAVVSRMQNNLTEWALYTQSVNARPQRPTAKQISCLSQKYFLTMAISCD